MPGQSKVLPLSPCLAIGPFIYQLETTGGRDPQRLDVQIPVWFGGAKWTQKALEPTHNKLASELQGSLQP